MVTQAPTTISYPETDGLPLPDGETQAPQYVRILGTVTVHFRNVPGARVNGNTFIYYVEGNRNRRISPDCYVLLGMFSDAEESFERNNTYLLWEIGKAPDFVLEIGSESTADVDLGSKRDLYAELGVGEYWRYDPTGGEFYGDPLVGEILVEGEYRPIPLNHKNDGRVWGHSDALNLELWWDDGDLRFWDPVAGRWLLSQDEERDSRVAAEDRAAAAEDRATAERASRVAAEARLAELEAELRRLRR